MVWILSGMLVHDSHFLHNLHSCEPWPTRPCTPQVNFLSSYLHTKQPILGLTQEWFRESSFSRLESGVHDRLHIYRLCGDILLHLHRQPIEGTDAYNVSSEIHGQCGVNTLVVQVSKRRSYHRATAPHKRSTVCNVESQVFTPKIQHACLVRGSNYEPVA